MKSACVVSRKSLNEHLSTAIGRCITTACLAHIPAEIRDEISTYLGINELLSLLRVCHSIHHALELGVRAFLYNRVHFVARCTIDAGKYQIHEPLPAIDLLLRTILRQPHFSSHIRSFAISLQHAPTRLGTLYRRFQPFDAQDLQRAAVLLDISNASYSEHWMQKLRQGRLDVILGLLISQLSNLNTLSVPPDFQRLDSFMGLVIERRLMRSQHLREVFFADSTRRYSHRHYRECKTECSLPILYAPMLENLTLTLPHVRSFRGWDNWNPGLLLKWPVADPPVAVNLHRLALHQSRIAEVSLGLMLECCPSLKELIFEYEGRRTYRPHIDCVELGRALQRVRRTLRFLKLAVDWGSDEAEEPHDDGSDCLHEYLGPILKTFPHLVDLEISPVLLFGWAVNGSLPLVAVLPPNIQNLRFRHDLWYMLDFEWWEDAALLKMIHALSEDGKKRTPNLINFENNGGIDESVESAITTQTKITCAQACQTHGIEVKLFSDDELFVLEEQGITLGAPS